MQFLESHSCTGKIVDWPCRDWRASISDDTTSSGFWYELEAKPLMGTAKWTWALLVQTLSANRANKPYTALMGGMSSGTGRPVRPSESEPVRCMACFAQRGVLGVVAEAAAWCTSFSVADCLKASTKVARSFWRSVSWPAASLTISLHLVEPAYPRYRHLEVQMLAMHQRGRNSVPRPTKEGNIAEATTQKVFVCWPS